jgi:hypothetical protein
MREPYATLLRIFDGNPIVDPYLWGDEPEWQGLHEDDRIPACLSAGEQVLLDIAWAIHTGYGPAGIGVLDASNRRRVIRALELAYCDA